MLQTVLLLFSAMATTISGLPQLPYTPTRFIVADNGSIAYVLSPNESTSQYSLSLLDTNDTVQPTATADVLYQNLPFLSQSTSKAFVSVADDEGIAVLAGDCQARTDQMELWKFTLHKDYKNGTWVRLPVVVDNDSLNAEYLSAGFVFSPSASTADSSIYVFGGMCPSNDINDTANWVSDASYSNTMLTLSMDSESNSNAAYQVSITGLRAPPIAEAGLTITPLLPTFSNTSTTSISQQQNFILLGGHTQNAFINMSQVAMFSLPQESWAFIDVNQPGQTDDTELMRRNEAQVEPRSGHTAVLTEDGTKIIVFGGWVGDISTPAQPQLVVLDIGQGYGGTGGWAWTIPSKSSGPFGLGQGIYGHGATLLEGGVMAVTGGSTIVKAGTKLKRQNASFYFLNTTSMSWINSYVNPNSPGSPAYTVGSSHASSSLNSSQKAGIGAGVGFGLLALIAIVIFWISYSKRLRRWKAIREKKLRELALGAERYHSPSLEDEDEDVPEHILRTTSWGHIPERQDGDAGNYSWPLSLDNDRQRFRTGFDNSTNSVRQAERTGVAMDYPSPTRGLRRSLHSRGAPGSAPYFAPVSSNAPGVFRIDEEEEGSQSGSLRVAKPSQTTHIDRSSAHSDPFKDPPVLVPTDAAAEERKRELESWTEDWQSAAESMNLSRNPSQATHGRTYSSLSQTTNGRTYSNLSQAHSYSNSHSGSGSSPSGRGSPEKSDRTGSNLSERSLYSQPSSKGNLSRNVSQRSASAGYALFSGAAAAMNRIATGNTKSNSQGEFNTTVTRVPSNRSVSFHFGSMSEASRASERTFLIERPSISNQGPNEKQTLLTQTDPNASLRKSLDFYGTPPESPTRERYGRASSLTKSGAKALGLLGSVKRVFTGTTNVDVADRVAAFENRSGQSSPTKHSGHPEMAEAVPRRSVSAGHAFWRGKRGAKDWGEDVDIVEVPKLSTGTVRRKPVPGSAVATEANHDDKFGKTDEEDWDIETAVQKRVVQVMFTIPKEKLRVVNADALSLLSSNRSEVDHEEERDRDREIKRMSSLNEGDESSVHKETRQVCVDDTVDHQSERKLKVDKGKSVIRDHI